MNSILFHLLVIPGLFLLGWLAHSVKVVYFRAEVKKRAGSDSNLSYD